MTEDDRLPSLAGPTAPEARSRGSADAAAPGARPNPHVIDRRVLDAMLALLLFAAALAWFSLTLDRTFHLTDEGYLLRMGQRVAEGEATHRDFIEDYGPGVFAAIGALWRMGDGEILFVRQAIAVWKALAVVLAFALTRRLVGWPTALGVGLLSIVFWGRASLNVNAPHAALMTAPLCMASAGLLMWAMQGGTPEDDAMQEPEAGAQDAIGEPEAGAQDARGAAAERRRKILIACAGFVGGLAVLFKQSLGVMNAYGLGLALIGLALGGLDPAAPVSSAAAGSDRTASLAPRATWVLWAVWALWAALSLGLILPGFHYLGVVDYAVHFLPIHVLMVFIAVAYLRQPNAPPIGWWLRDRLVPLAVGAAIPLGLVAFSHWQSGHLDELLIGMFERPLRRRNYAIPTFLPPLGISLFVSGAGLCLAGACAWLGRRARIAAVCAGAGLAGMAIAVFFVPHSNPELYTAKVLLRAAPTFDWIMHSLTLLAAAALFGPRIVARASRARNGEPSEERPATPPEEDLRRLRGVLPLFFFAGLLCFQIYPRGAHNVWLVQACWMPLLAVTLHEAWRRGSCTASPARRRAAAVLFWLVPAWLAWPVATGSWQLHQAPHRALALPHTEGMQVARSSIAQWHLDDVEALAARLAQAPPGPLLLVGGDAMLYVVTDRPALRPEHEYAVQNVVLDMLPLRELSALDDGGWASALEAKPDTIVVVARNPAGRRVLEALPSLKAYLDGHYSVSGWFGRYQLMEAEVASGREPAPPDRRTPR